MRPRKPQNNYLDIVTLSESIDTTTLIVGTNFIRAIQGTDKSVPTKKREFKCDKVKLLSALIHNYGDVFKRKCL